MGRSLPSPEAHELALLFVRKAEGESGEGARHQPGRERQAAACSTGASSSGLS